VLDGWRVEIVATDLAQVVLERSKRHLQPVRGAARTADSDAGEVFPSGRRHVADQCRHSLNVSVKTTEPAARHLSSRHVRRGLLPHVLIYFDLDTKAWCSGNWRRRSRGRLSGAGRGGNSGGVDRHVPSDAGPSRALSPTAKVTSPPLSPRLSDVSALKSTAVRAIASFRAESSV